MNLNKVFNLFSFPPPGLLRRRRKERVDLPLWRGPGKGKKKGIDILISLLGLFFFFSFFPINLFSQSTPPKEIGVVLAGGGALGLAHIGVLQVLEELEIPIDRIGGTSMGGLVGGLYAIGYTSDQLETLALEMDWGVMMGNSIDRKNAPFSARNDQERFIFSALRKGVQIELGAALIDGTNIYQKFQELCAPALDVRDFEKLPIPFYCVAADLEFEDQVVFSRGYLPDVLRATMSIPLVFNPVKIDDMLLVDGGMLNNFPVREMRQKGADLVIGVQIADYDSTSNSTGLINLIGRTYQIVMDKVRCEYEDEPDVLINLSFPDLNPSDFDEAETLIALGREAAEKIKEELKEYKSDRFKKREQLIVEDKKHIIDSIFIDGEKHIKEEKIRNILELPIGTPVLFSEVQTAMEKLQASSLFESMRYRIDREGNKNILKLFLEEKNGNFFKIGLRYDNDFGASLLLNSTFRHTFVGGDYAAIDIRLNRNPLIRTEYIYRSLKKYTPFVRATLKGDDYFRFTGERNDYELFQHNQVELKGGLRWTPYNSVQIKTGLEWQWYGFNEDADQNIIKPLGRHLLNYFIETTIDRLDHAAYPKQGHRAYINAKFLTPSLSDFTDADNNIWMSAGLFKALPFTRHVSGKISADIGLSTGFIDQQYLFYQGGLYQHLRDNFIRLPGIPIMRFNGQNMASLGFETIIEIKNIHHVQAGYLMSTLNAAPGDLIDGKWRQGIYVGYGLETLIGPIKINIGFPLEDLDMDIFISAGHNF
ncbi:MAG: patatin-like phospholipase family protein [Bacteroidota bacterium]